MSSHQSKTALGDFDKTAEQAFSASTQAMSKALHVPAACMRENMKLMQSRVQAYSEFARACGNGSDVEDIAHAYSEFGNRMLADYVHYYQGIARAMMGAMPDGKWRDR